jgi:hypothetical protein
MHLPLMSLVFCGHGASSDRSRGRLPPDMDGWMDGWMDG